MPTAYSQFNIMQKVRYKPTEYVDIQYGFHYSATSSYGRYDRHNRMRNGLPRYAEWDYGPQKWMMNMLSIEYSKAKVAFDKVAFRFAHQLFEESRIDRSLNKDDRTTNAEKVNAYSVNLDLVKKIKEKNTLFYGVEYVYDKVKSTGEITDISTNETVEGPARYPQSSWQSVGLYITDEYRVLPKLTLTAGLRYNHVIIDSKFDTSFYSFPFTEAKISKGALSGSLGLAYKPMSDFVIHANFGTGFRAPNVDDIGKVFDSEPGAVTVPNPGLKPEYAYNVDLGLTKIFADRVKIDITGYYTRLKNAMVRRDFTLNGEDSIMYQGTLSQVQAIQNAAKAYVWGIQAGIEVKLPLNFYVSSDVNIQKGKEELDNGDLSPLHRMRAYGLVFRV
ncbi:MAG: TonB-dependent receptor [Chitinophagales bacterium]